jgi:hypothetical protein
MHDPTNLSRRDFGKLSVAALAGLSLAGGASFAADSKKSEKSPLLGDPHACRGLNTCKGKGADKEEHLRGNRNLRDRQEPSVRRLERVQGARRLWGETGRECLQNARRLPRASREGRLEESSQTLRGPDEGRQ